MSKIEQAAIELVAAKRARAAARTTLTRLRRQWLVDNDDFFDRHEDAHAEGGPAMLAAMQARTDAQHTFRKAWARLLRAAAATQEKT